MDRVSHSQPRLWNYTDDVSNREIFKEILQEIILLLIQVAANISLFNQRSRIKVRMTDGNGCVLNETFRTVRISAKFLHENYVQPKNTATIRLELIMYATENVIHAQN